MLSIVDYILGISCFLIRFAIHRTVEALVTTFKSIICKKVRIRHRQVLLHRLILSGILSCLRIQIYLLVLNVGTEGKHPGIIIEIGLKLR